MASKRRKTKNSRTTTRRAMRTQQNSLREYPAIVRLAPIDPRPFDAVEKATKELKGVAQKQLIDQITGGLEL